MIFAFGHMSKKKHFGSRFLWCPCSTLWLGNTQAMTKNCISSDSTSHQHLRLAPYSTSRSQIAVFLPGAIKLVHNSCFTTQMRILFAPLVRLRATGMIRFTWDQQMSTRKQKLTNPIVNSSIVPTAFCFHQAHLVGNLHGQDNWVPPRFIYLSILLLTLGGNEIQNWPHSFS